MKENEIILIKEVPEYINIESGKYKNIPVSGIVIESIGSPLPPFCGGSSDFYDEAYPSPQSVGIYDPRGFRVQISLENLENLMRNTSIVNGVIQEELFYASRDVFSDPWSHRRNHEILWLASEKDNLKPIVSDSKLIPGNRYSYINEDVFDYFRLWRRHKEKANLRTLVYLGELSKTLWYGKYQSVGKEVIRAFVDLETGEFVPHVSSRACWFLIREQDPDDVELVNRTVSLFNGSMFGKSGKISKLDISEITSEDSWEMTIEEFVQKSKHDSNIPGLRFIKKISDKEIHVLMVSPYSRADRRRINSYELKLNKVCIDNKHGLNEDYSFDTLSWDLIEGYLVSMAATSVCVNNSRRYRNFINVTDSSGNVCSYGDICEDSVPLKII